MPRTAEDEAKKAMNEIIRTGTLTLLAQTKEPSRRWLIECAEVHLSELVCFDELNGDYTVVEAARDAR